MARTISTAVSGGVYLVSTDTPLTITSTGSITTTASGSDAISGSAGTAWQVTNYGTVSGVIGTSAAGMYFAGSGVSVVNSGTIKGYTAGIWASNGGSFTNNAGGLISAVSNYGIYVGGAPGTVTNAGTISSGWYAVDFAYTSAANRLIVAPGAVFNGLVSGGSGTLELASGASSGTFSGLNTGSFTNFGALVVDSGATWTLSGTNTIASVTDNGTLIVTGSLPAASYQIGSTGGGGTLEVASAPGTASPMNFAGNSTLVIDNAGAFGTNVGTSTYTGPLLEHFAAGDTVDIKNVSSSGASLTYNSATGLLQIVNGAQSASLDFQTSTLGSGTFTLAPDASGSGLYLTLSSGPAVTESLVADTGSSSTDKITSNDALTGTAGANATVTFTEGTTTLGTATASASGVWNFTPTSLTQGAHTIVATSGSASASLTFTYDTVPPAVTESLVNNIGSGGQNVTADGALTGSGDPNALVTLSENGTTLGTTTANASGVWNYTPSSLTVGAHTIVASESDLAGNTGTASLSFTYSPPVSIKLVSDTGSSSTDGITSNDALTGVAGANAAVTLTEGGTTLGTATASASGVWNFTPTSLAQGANTITATSGGSSASLTFTYDNVPPAVTESLVNNIGSGGQNVTADGALTGSGDPNATVTLTEGTTTLGTTTANASGVWNYTPSSLTAGAHTIVASETDAAGNTGTASLSFTYSPPPVTVSLVADTGSSSTDGITSNDALTGTAGASATVTLKEGTTTLGTATASASGVWNFTPTSLAQGANTITATSGGSSASLTFTYDTVAPSPVFTQTPPATGATSTATFGFGTSNSDTGVVYGYKLDSATTWTQVSGTSLTLSGLSNGAHTLLLEATDAAGNISSNDPSYNWSVGSSGGQTISSAVTGPLTLTSSGNPLTVTSTGSVKTTASGTDAIDGDSSQAWSITNAGTVSSSQRYGISLHSSGSSIVNSGTISGYSGQGGYGVDMEAGGTITNSSTGMITGGEDAIFGYGAAVNVDNSGKIISTYDDGIGLFGGGSIINRAGATIQAPTSGGFGPAGIYIPGGSASIQNYGTISGQYGAYLSVAGTVENAGTISGTSYALDFAATSASNKLIVDPGAVFNGTVTGGSGTLELASGTGSISGVSSSGAFQNFQTLAVDAGGTWTLNGADSIANLIDNGVLNIGGSLAVSTAVNPASTGAFDLLAGSTFEVAAMAAQSDQVNFQGGASLVIDNAASFGVNAGKSTYAGPLIENFGSNSSIDIKNVSSTNASFTYNAASGLLQISNSAGQTASLDFQNSTLGSGSFQLAADGHGGVLVTHK